jgi:hypothetical protein
MDNTQQPPVEATKKCKYCKSEIPKDAQICPHCRKRVAMGTGGKIVAGIFGFVVLVAVIGSVAGSNSSSSSSPGSSSQTAPAPTPTEASLAVGDTGYLYEGGSLTQKIEVSTTKDNMGQLIQLAIADDTLGMAKMVLDGQAFIADPGTQVRVIDISFPDAYEVRIMSGQNYSQSGWLPGEFISHTKLSSSTTVH